MERAGRRFGFGQRRTRKPGAAVVWVRTEGNLAPTMVEGKLTGGPRRDEARSDRDRQRDVAGRQVVHLDYKVRWPGTIYHGRQGGLARRKGRRVPQRAKTRARRAPTLSDRERSLSALRDGPLGLR